MAGLEGAADGLTIWQGLGGAAATFIAVGTAIFLRIIGTKKEASATGDSGKHIVLEQASLADSTPFIEMSKDIAAIRRLMENELVAADHRREDEEKDMIKDRLDKADKDRNELMRMIADIKAGRDTKMPI